MYMISYVYITLYIYTHTRAHTHAHTHTQTHTQTHIIWYITYTWPWFLSDIRVNATIFRDRTMDCFFKSKLRDQGFKSGYSSGSLSMMSWSIFGTFHQQTPVSRLFETQSSFYLTSQSCNTFSSSSRGGPHSRLLHVFCALKKNMPCFSSQVSPRSIMS